jgi:hypothetical protein
MNNPFIGTTNGGPLQNEPKIRPEDLKTLTCEYCSCQVFAEALIIKTVSPLLTKNGKEGMVPVPVFYCTKCHQPVQKYLPEEFQEKSPLIST